MTSTIINFPSYTKATSKLQSKMLKRPPNPIDWIEQSYMDMVEDTQNYEIDKMISPTTIEILKKKYSQSKSNTVTVYLNQQESTTHYSTINEETVVGTDHPTLVDSYIQFSDKEEYKTNKNDDGYDDDDLHTYTTASTDINRKNNVFRYYREQQQQHKCPINDDLLPVPSIQTIQPIIMNNLKYQQPLETKKGFKMIGKKLISRMKLTIERPFKSIDNHF